MFYRDAGQTLPKNLTQHSKYPCSSQLPAGPRHGRFRALGGFGGAYHRRGLVNSAHGGYFFFREFKIKDIYVLAYPLRMH